MGASGISYAQNTFPSTGNVGIGTSSPTAPLDIKKSPESNSAERFFKATVSDAVGDEITIENVTGINGVFVPGIKGLRSTDNRFALTLLGVLAGSDIDAGTNAVMAFDARLTTSKIVNRPLFVWKSYTTDYMTMSSNGNLGIGTATPQAKLAVNGNILAKEIKIKTDISVPDYVFEPDYKMRSLAEIENYVKEHKHLPEIPSAKEIGEQGLDLATMNLLLLKKVEELTLHAIYNEKAREEQQLLIKKQEKAIVQLTKRIEYLESPEQNK
jgi:hypothetical protein